MILINEKSGGFPEKINLSIQNISLDLKGTLHLSGIKVGHPQVSHINHMSIDVSLLGLAKGVFNVTSIALDSVKLIPSELIPFFENLKSTEALKNKPFEFLNLESTDVYINTTVILSMDSSKPASINDMDLKFALSPKGYFNWFVKTDEIINPGLPQINETRAEGHFSPKKITVKKMNLSTISGDFTGNFTYTVAPKKIRGTISFKKFNLDKLTRSGFFGDGKVKGKISGDLKLKGNLQSLDALQSLANIKGVVSASDLPFQKSKVVKNFMPALKDVHFNKFSISKIYLEKDKIRIEGLKGSGDPLSVEGEGHITLEGKVYFKLFCVLTEKYYETLQPIVKDGIRKDKEDRRTFNCEIVGDLQNQKIKLNKVISQVLKTNIRKIGRGIKNLFR